MANQAQVATSGALRDYSSKLNQSAEHFVNLLQFINMESHRVLDSWGDEKSIRFMQELESSKREIEKLSRSMIEFSQYIKRLADRVDDYSYQN